MNMYNLMARYYNNVQPDTFRSDLRKKDHVFLLRHPKTHAIKGFSTIKRVEKKVDGEKFRGFFSGDTIIDKQYWGKHNLGMEVLKYLLKEKLKAPLTPYYWFLISKGYKTYLLMTNNFTVHYPRYEVKTPSKFKKAMDSFYGEAFSGYYNSEEGIIEPYGDAQNLSEPAAKPDDKLLKENERVKYFVENNKDWEQGAELACIAELTLDLPFTYSWKVLNKSTKKMLETGKLPGPLNNSKVARTILQLVSKTPLIKS